MHSLKEMFKDKKLMKYSWFIIFVMALIYILYFVIKNFDVIASACGHAVGSFLGALAPLFIGLLLAYLINPAVTKLDENFISKIFKDLPDPEKDRKRQKQQRIVSTLFAYIVILVAIFLVIYIFASLLLKQVRFGSFQEMMDSITSYIMSCEHAVKSWAEGLPSGAFSDKVFSMGNAITKWISENLTAANAIQQVTAIGSSVVNFVLGIIVSFWLVMDKEFFLRLWNRFSYAVLPGRGGDVLNRNFTEVNIILSRFIRGILLDTVIIAVLSSIILSILGLKFAVAIGVFAGICNVIPYFGPVLGMIPAFIVGFINGGIIGGIIPVIALFAVQQVDSNFIYPKVVGSSTGLHPVTVLLAVVVGGVYGGIVGMILAVPVTSLLKLYIGKLIRHIEKSKEKKKTIPDGDA